MLPFSDFMACYIHREVNNFTYFISRFEVNFLLGINHKRARQNFPNIYISKYIAR